MKDYYKILGVEEEASEEEIRARWMELIKHYHPDLGRTEEGDEKIREINEAYEILKNESTRFQFDLERALKRSFIKKALRPKERGIRIRKIVVPAGILVLFLIVGLISLQWFHVGSGPQFGVPDERDQVSGKKTASQIRPIKKKSKVQGGQEVRKEYNKKNGIPQESKEVVSVSPQHSPSGMESKSKRKGEPTREILPESIALLKVEKEAPARVEKEVPKEGSGGVPKEIAKVDSPPVPPPSLVKEEEVMRFFSDYIDRYHRKDIDGFLSFFSTKALQNRKDGLKGIRTIYTKFFDQSQELRYHLEGMKTEIYQNSVEVKARFRVDQKLKGSGEEKVWTGPIRWVLGREDGALKIISLDYQNEKSP